MATTYDKIATTTLSSAGTITFSSIPATYTDLRFVLVGTHNTGAGCSFTYNSDATALYSFTSINGNGTAAASVRATAQSSLSLSNANISATTPQLFTIDIFSYAGSTFKTCLITDTQDLNGSGQVEMQVGLYRSATAISSIQLSATFKTGTTATLYGIKAA